MVKTIFRFLLALLAILIVSQDWGLVVSPDNNTYWYDQTYVTSAQNHNYGAAPNLISTSKQQPTYSLSEYSGIRFTLAFVDDFVATKSLADPKTIRFSQDSIKGTFRDGRSVQDLAAGLKNGSIKPGDVPAIRTVQRNGQTISIDNRRLSAFREAGVPIRTRPATAKEIIQAERQGKFSAGASGTDNIRIRGQ